jgi:N-methylhydantoinase B
MATADEAAAESPVDDPVTLEIARNMADSIAEEMVVSLIRTSYSTNIKDRQDTSTGVYNRDGEMISQAPRASPIHTGTLAYVVQMITEKFAVDEMNEGDVYAYNIPYPVGPHHLSDITVAAPVFADGEVFGFVASQAHHVDLGGSEPGSMPYGVTEIYQEGLQIPPVKLLEGGEENEDVLDMIRQNVRTERVTEGDLWAQIAAANTGKKRLHEFIQKFGKDDSERYIDQMTDYAERRMRNGIRETIPDGTYEYEDFIEGDSINDDLIRLHAEITVDGGDVTVDLTGCNDQVKGPLNYVPSAAIACIHYAIQAIIDPDMPTNVGTTRPIEVVTRKGSVIQPEYPAPVCSAGMVTAQRLVDVIFGAMKEAVPERICAACSGTMNLFNIGGFHPETGEYFNYVETYGGGQGAMYDKDGMDGVHNHMTNTRNAPIEVLENTYPFLIREYALVEDSDGAGKYRGGVGIKRDIQILNEEVKITLSSDRQRIAPWGVDGGHDAAPSECKIIRNDGSVEEFPPKFSTRLEADGARIITKTPGGGGWGDPHERDPEKVLNDVRSGLVARERARDEYGVAITDDLEIDEERTRQLRDE